MIDRLRSLLVLTGCIAVLVATSVAVRHPVTVHAQGSTRLPVAADYNGDGILDLATYDTATFIWTIDVVVGSALSESQTQFGAPGDLPFPADYDRDGKADIAVYRPQTNQWFILQSHCGCVESR